MANVERVDHVKIHGATLAALLSSAASGDRVCDGLLFGACFLVVAACEGRQSKQETSSHTHTHTHALDLSLRSQAVCS